MWETAQKAVGLLPDAAAQRVTGKPVVDRLDALHTAIKAVRRSGSVSISGMYGGVVGPMPMMEAFDRGVQPRMGQAHVRRWIEDLMPLVTDPADPLGVLGLAQPRDLRAPAVVRYVRGWLGRACPQLNGEWER